MQFWKTPGRMPVALVGMMAATAVLGLASGAQAQTGNRSLDPFRIKVGGYFPYDTQARRDIGGNFISYGVGYDIRRFGSFLPATLEAYFDYFERDRGESGDRRGARLYGGGLAVRYLLDPNPGPNPLFYPYAGAGVGLYSARASRSADGFSQRRDRTSLGGKFLLGTEIRNGIFGEAEYNFVPHPSVFGNDVELSGFQLRLGYRFGSR